MAEDVQDTKSNLKTEKEEKINTSPNDDEITECWQQVSSDRFEFQFRGTFSMKIG